MSERPAPVRTPPPHLGLSVVRGALRILSRTSTAAASRVAADLFMKPRRFSAPGRERELMTGADSFRVSAAGIGIRAWRWGAGPAVLLVHGWEGRGSQLATFAAPLVEAGFSVFTFDAPAHGHSDGNRSSLPHFTWALRAVADAAGDLHGVVAHSFGCAAATLAMHDGLDVERAVYFAPPLDPADYTERFAEIFGLDEQVLAKMKSRIEERFLRKWSDYSLAPMAAKMTAPLLVVHDRHDTETYWDEGAALVKAWPQARLITTEGLGHRRILREQSLIDATVGWMAGRVELEN